MRSVCPRWRAAARSQALPPPLPLLVLPKFELSCLTSDEALTAPRHPLMPEEVAADDARYVCSYDGWVVGVTQIRSKYLRHVDGELVDSGHYAEMDDKCFLVNAFSRRVVHLPQLCRTSDICAPSSSTAQVTSVLKSMARIRCHPTVVLSASPDSGSKYIVAASSDTVASGNLALWQPGMTSWHVCSGPPLDGPKDIAFYQGKLYVLQSFIRTDLFAFVLKEDDRGIVISRVEHCMTEPLPPHPMEQNGFLRCNMVVYYDSNYMEQDSKIIKVEVFALDVSKNPYRLTRVRSFNGDSIFIGSGSSKSFPASLHDGAEGDLIYFVPEYWSPTDRFVYNMRDGKMRPFSAKLLPFEGHVEDHSPVWLFPSE
uniref:KIB1-4 beta-propeller domain-containing protein n=1 Tax=Setaria italica TaxID=4555 RepID=K3ZP40_SETIT